MLENTIIESVCGMPPSHISREPDWMFDVGGFSRLRDEPKVKLADPVYLFPAPVHRISTTFAIEGQTNKPAGNKDTSPGFDSMPEWAIEKRNQRERLPV